jgi:hypothetical protein
MSKKISCLLIFIGCCGLCTAQQVVSSGGYTRQSEVSVDWILGGSLSDIPVYGEDAMSLWQAEQLKESEISLNVYPKPAIDLINIEITSADTGRLILKLYDNAGVEIMNRQVSCQPIVQLDISDVPCGIYYLKVFSANQHLFFKTEKIIKSKTSQP